VIDLAPANKSMGESFKGIRDALKIMGIVEATGKDADMPQASWDFYEMFQAFIQVIGNC